MKLSDIKLNQSLKEVKQLVYADENFILETMPSFIMTEYKSVQNLDTKKEIFVLFKDNKIVDIKNSLKDIADLEKADKFLGWILENV